MAVAFATLQGVNAVLPAVRSVATEGEHAEVLVGLDLHGSQPRALDALREAAADCPRLEVYVYVPRQARSGGIYHPKLYMAEHDDAGIAVVGSSNLTPGGLRSNVEVNLVAHLALDGEVWAALQETYAALKLPNARELTAEIASAYAADWEGVGKATAPPRPSTRLLEALGAAKQAPARRRDLSGWQAQVWDALPDGTFTTADAYAQEASFQAAHPENRHVRPKVRQILQQLRDIGLLEHVGVGRWRKRGSMEDEA